MSATPSKGRSWRRDTIAGFVSAVVSVPDGLAAAALAGVNPVYGLYTSIAAPLGAGPLLSARLMQIATTSASALVVGQTIRNYPEAQRDQTLFLLVLLTGGFLLLFGLLRLGRLVRFVSYAVMSGFLIGVAVVLILDQLAPFVGVSPTGRNEIVQFIDLLAHGTEFDARTIATGALALALAVGLGRTRVGPLSSVVALVVPTLLVRLLGWRSVRLVSDVSPIPRGIPSPALPELSLFEPGLLFPAFALAVVIAVQGAGVSESVENPDGAPVNPSRDMLAQGSANILSGLFSGIPAGGSVGQTALNVSVGATSRWSGIFGGLWMLVIVLLVPGVIGQVPMAVLAALMIVAGVSAIDYREAFSIWNTGGAARVALLVTFGLTLVLSVPLAVASGVVLTILLFVGSSASDVKLRMLVPVDDGQYAERPPPAELPSDAVTVLVVYGSLFFGGARTLQDRLPIPDNASRPVVVLRLRGRSRVGATLIEVLDDYADALAEVGGRLYLSGVGEEMSDQLRRAGKLDLEQTVTVMPADEVIGSSTSLAVAAGRAWLGRPRPT